MTWFIALFYFICFLFPCVAYIYIHMVSLNRLYQDKQIWLDFQYCLEEREEKRRWNSRATTTRVMRRCMQVLLFIAKWSKSRKKSRKSNNHHWRQSYIWGDSKMWSVFNLVHLLDWQRGLSFSVILRERLTRYIDPDRHGPRVSYSETLFVLSVSSFQFE